MSRLRSELRATAGALLLVLVIGGVGYLLMLYVPLG